MNRAEFDRSIEQLKRVYGDRAYPLERCELFFSEFSRINSFHWGEVIRNLIKDRKTPPMGSEFRQYVAKQQDSYRVRRKQQESDETKSLLNPSRFDTDSCTYSPGDVVMMCATISKRMVGEVPDHEYTDFVEMLRDTADTSDKIRDNEDPQAPPV